MIHIRTARYWKSFWSRRKINWEESYTSTWNHPHRALICEILKQFEWKSLIEIGCGSGANLLRIVKTFPGIQIGGVDINPDAIEAAKKIFGGALLRVGAGDNLMFSDNATDVVLTDRMLIYVNPHQIDRYIKEIKRIGRHKIVLCEFHESSLWKRLKLRFTAGYYAYDYTKLLHRHGFYDVILYKIPATLWPGDTYPSFVLMAKIPKRK